MKRIAFIWGFAEATLFFIIPDVYLTYVAMTYKNKTSNLQSILSTLCGALLGGSLIYITAVYNPNKIQHVLLSVPSVQPYMLDHVINVMNKNPFTGLISGPLFGVPYKLFAFEAPNYMNIISFILISIPARLFRFILVTIIAYWLSHHVFHQFKHQSKIIIWSIVWIIVYILYFAVHG